jgi:hypothetical protein
VGQDVTLTEKKMGAPLVRPGLQLRKTYPESWQKSQSMSYVAFVCLYILKMKSETEYEVKSIMKIIIFLHYISSLFPTTYYSVSPALPLR